MKLMRKEDNNLVKLGSIILSNYVKLDEHNPDKIKLDEKLDITDL